MAVTAYSHCVFCECDVSEEGAYVLIKTANKGHRQKGSKKDIMNKVYISFESGGKFLVCPDCMAKAFMSTRKYTANIGCSFFGQLKIYADKKKNKYVLGVDSSLKITEESTQADIDKISATMAIRALSQ